MKMPNSQKVANEIEIAWARLATAEGSVQSARDESRVAKRKRKKAKEAARRAKKRLRRAKEELAEARCALAQAEKSNAVRARTARVKKPVKTGAIKRTQAKMVKKATQSSVAQPVDAAAGSAGNFTTQAEGASESAAGEPITEHPSLVPQNQDIVVRP